MIKVLLPRKWLLVYIGTIDEDIKTVERCIDHVTNTIGLRKPLIKIERIDKSITRSIGATITVEGEVQELFVENIINCVDQYKKGNWNNVAIIMPRNAFVNADVFKQVVDHYAFDNISCHPICYPGDFLNISIKSDCVTRSCKKCVNFDKCQMHSCLLRLIWLLFDSDDRVIDRVKEVVGLPVPTP